MTRRKFLKQSIGGGALVSLVTPVAAQSAQMLRVLSTDKAAAETLAAQISAASGGTLTLDVTVVEIADAATLLDRVASGDADMCLTSLDHFMDKNMALGLFASIPFGMSMGELEGWMSASDGADVLAMLVDGMGVTLRFAGETGNTPMWSKQPLSDLATLQGLNVGSRGLGLVNLTQIGVRNVVDLDDPATNLADLDVIDGMSAKNLAENGLADAFTHVTTTNPNTPSAVLTAAINTGVMDGLTPQHRLIVERACDAGLALSRAQQFHDEANIMASRGTAVTATDLPTDIWTTLSDGAQGVLEAIFEGGNTQANAVDAYVYFLKDVAGWSEIGEAAFYTGRKRLNTL